MDLNSRAYFENLIAEYCGKLTTHLTTKEEKARWFSGTFSKNWSDISTMSIDELGVLLTKIRKACNDIDKASETPRKKPTCAKECSFRLDDSSLYKY